MKLQHYTTAASVAFSIGAIAAHRILGVNSESEFTFVILATFFSGMAAAAVMKDYFNV